MPVDKDEQIADNRGDFRIARREIVYYLPLDAYRVYSAFQAGAVCPVQRGSSSQVARVQGAKWETEKSG